MKDSSDSVKTPSEESLIYTFWNLQFELIVFTIKFHKKDEFLSINES